MSNITEIELTEEQINLLENFILGNIAECFPAYKFDEEDIESLKWEKDSYDSIMKIYFYNCRMPETDNTATQYGKIGIQIETNQICIVIGHGDGKILRRYSEEDERLTESPYFNDSVEVSDSYFKDAFLPTCDICGEFSQDLEECVCGNVYCPECIRTCESCGLVFCAECTYKDEDEVICDDCRCN